MKIASWNVNSLRARHDLVINWLRHNEPDVLCMQETKVTDDEFPAEELLRLGYAVASAGQKTYNGVAIAARAPMSNVQVGLVDSTPSEDKRLISAEVAGVAIFCAYVPNGKALDSPSYGEKLEWLGRLRRTLDERCQPTDDVVLCGDFNIARDDRDVHNPEQMRGQIHFSQAEHRALDEVLAFGLTDTFRLYHEEPGSYSWWDYRGGSFRRDAGLRIDYLFASESMVQRCRQAQIDRDERAKAKPSDHVPVIAEFTTA